MKKHKFLIPLGLLALAALLALLTSSCKVSPVRKVLDSTELTRQMADSIALRGLCLNDTVSTEVVRDTVIYQTSHTVSTVVVSTPIQCRLDTVVSGVRVRLSDGRLTIEDRRRIEQRLKTVVKTQTVRDKSRETVLEKQITRLERAELTLQRELLAQQRLVSTRTRNFWIATCLLVVAGVLFVRKTFF